MNEGHTQERVILAGIKRDKVSQESFDYRMDELKALVYTAGGEVVGTITQGMAQPRAGTYLGKGKLEELASAAEEWESDLIVFNDELTPSQLRNITEKLDTAVIDRTQLILDIFAQRANSREGKLQVELAQMSYTLPRLRGQGHVLSRLGGGIGTRGPGETKLETDQRHIRDRMTDLRRQLDNVAKHRVQYRERRKQNEAFQVALIGYTNAGKSTLLNKLSSSDVLMEDKLFATLDPTTKKVKLPSGFDILLTDTVGFIQQLPTTLVAAFRSTLEEVKEADYLLHVVDASHADADNHELSVQKLLEELEASHIPVLTVYNKRDKIVGDFIASQAAGNSILISTNETEDLQELMKRLEAAVMAEFKPYISIFKAKEGKWMSRLKEETIIHKQVFHEENETYEVRGYASPSSSIHAEILKEKRGE